MKKFNNGQEVYDRVMFNLIDSDIDRAIAASDAKFEELKSRERKERYAFLSKEDKEEDESHKPLQLELFDLRSRPITRYDY